MSVLKSRIRSVGVAAIVALASTPTDGAAQLNGQNTKGDAGLKSGSQAPAGVYGLLPLYLYSADAVKDRNGETVATGDLNAALWGVGVNVVTNWRIFGANYGFMFVLPWTDSRLQGVGDFLSEPPAGLTDSYLQPISLGWQTSRADIMAAYGLFIPTGRYEDGADDNTGLGMWGHEFLLGTTLYLNEQRTLHFATTATYDIQSTKKDSDVRVGNILNLEGGAGADFLDGGLSVGLAYYATFKVTEDDLGPSVPPGTFGKNSIWGLGPEVSLAIATSNRVYGILTARYQWEMAARVATEGSAWNIMLAVPIPPIAIQ